MLIRTLGWISWNCSKVSSKTTVSRVGQQCQRVTHPIRPSFGVLRWQPHRIKRKFKQQKIGTLGKPLIRVNLHETKDYRRLSKLIIMTSNIHAWSINSLDVVGCIACGYGYNPNGLIQISRLRCDQKPDQARLSQLGSSDLKFRKPTRGCSFRWV